MVSLTHTCTLGYISETDLELAGNDEVGGSKTYSGKRLVLWSREEFLFSRAVEVEASRLRSLIVIQSTYTMGKPTAKALGKRKAQSGGAGSVSLLAVEKC